MKSKVKAIKPEAVDRKAALKIPQGVVLHPPSEETENKYIAEVPLLTGCRAWGDTPEEALNMLSHVAIDYIRSTKAEIASSGLEVLTSLRYQRYIQKHQRNIQRRQRNIQKCQRPIPRHQKPVRFFAVAHPINCIDFSRNGKYAATIGNITGDDSKPDVSILDIFTGKVTPLYGRGCQSYSIVRVALSSSGDFVLVAQDDGGILCWDVKNLVLHDFVGITCNTYEDSTNCIVFSPDDKHFAESLYQRAYIRDTLSGELIHHFSGYLSEHNQMAFSNDGEALFVVGKGGMINFDSRGRREPLFFANSKDIRAVSVFPDNQKLLSLEADGTITVWNAISGDEISHWSHTKSLSDVGDRLSEEEAEYGGLSVNTKDPYYKYRLPYLPSRSVAVSPDGKRILSGGCDQYMRLWDLDGVEIGEYQHNTRVIKVAFLSDGQRALSASWDGSISAWELPR